MWGRGIKRKHCFFTIMSPRATSYSIILKCVPWFARGTILHMCARTCDDAHVYAHVWRRADGAHAARRRRADGAARKSSHAVMCQHWSAFLVFVRSRAVSCDPMVNLILSDSSSERCNNYTVIRYFITWLSIILIILCSWCYEWCRPFLVEILFKKQWKDV